MNRDDLASELLEVAEEAARAAGDVLVEAFGGEDPQVRTKSTATDPVSEADEAAERAIREVLAQRRPEDAIVGEEGDDQAGETGMRWVVDPLDGTVNFLYGIPIWSVSVACEDADGAVAGVLLDPNRDECFAARRAGQFTLNGTPLHPPRADRLELALVGTGFAYDATVRSGQAEVAAAVAPRVRDLRRGGSAATDLAWTACGRLDAFYERSLQSWDVAAGLLLCARAGLEVHQLEPAGGLPAGVLVAPAPLAGPLLELVAG